MTTKKAPTISECFWYKTQTGNYLLEFWEYRLISWISCNIVWYRSFIVWFRAISWISWVSSHKVLHQNYTNIQRCSARQIGIYQSEFTPLLQPFLPFRYCRLCRQNNFQIGWNTLLHFWAFPGNNCTLSLRKNSLARILKQMAQTHWLSNYHELVFRLFRNYIQL